jgi:hypothetical protein
MPIYYSWRLSRIVHFIVALLWLTHPLLLLIFIVEQYDYSDAYRRGEVHSPVAAQLITIIIF